MSAGLALKASKITLSDILDNSDYKDNRPVNKSSTQKGPSLILGDWLYLGNRFHATSKETLKKLEITHVLNITELVPNAFNDIIDSYARIKVMDSSTVKLSDYFEASACFIDLCNPLNYDISIKKRKILVHCAMGISRSASITISYLMARRFVINDFDKQILNDIQNKLQILDNEIENEIKEYNINGFKYNKNNKDWTKRKRIKYNKINNNNNININKDICNGLNLGEAYNYVLKRRNVICPNIGFCQQLELWEKFVWDTHFGTVYQIPFFRPDFKDNIGNKPKKKTKKCVIL